MRKKPLYIAGIVIILVIGGILIYSLSNTNNNTLSVETNLSKHDMMENNNEFFEDICFSALKQFDFLYDKMDYPDFSASRLEYFYAETGLNSTNMNRIEFRFTFDYCDMTYSQSVNISDDKITSYLNASEKLMQPSKPNSISLIEFTQKIDEVDFNYFVNIKPNKPRYAFEYTGVSDIFFKNTESAKRYLINKDTIIDGKLDTDMKLVSFVPVIDFIGVEETEPGVFSDDEGVQIYINK